MLKGHIALASMRFIRGTTGQMLDLIARQFLWKCFLNYNHSTGHGVGQYSVVHEMFPRISMSEDLFSKMPIEIGMIVSNEPGCYLEGKYGIRIESIILAKEPKNKDFLEFETVTKVPIDISLVDFDMLTNEEELWLQKYNISVFEALQKELDSSVKSFIQRKYIKY